jgi:hypothetical protein
MRWGEVAFGSLRTWGMLSYNFWCVTHPQRCSRCLSPHSGTGHHAKASRAVRDAQVAMQRELRQNAGIAHASMQYGITQPVPSPRHHPAPAPRARRDLAIMVSATEPERCREDMRNAREWWTRCEEQGWRLSAPRRSQPPTAASQPCTATRHMCHVDHVLCSWMCRCCQGSPLAAHRHASRVAGPAAALLHAQRAAAWSPDHQLADHTLP